MTKILIVDDKPENLYLLQSMLEAEGYKTIPAQNGAEALGLLRTNVTDLIITDILMPVMDGFAFCRECKKDKVLRKIPFFFYTATYTDIKDEEFALKLGADKYIIKPQEPDEFLKILTDFLRESKKKKNSPKKITQPHEAVVLKEYNEILVKKIEDKMLQSEKSEKELRLYSEKLEREILEHKKSELSLKESRQIFITLAEASPVGIFRADSDGSTTYVNPKWTELSGLSSEEALGFGWLKAVHPDDRIKLSGAWSEDIRSAKESNAEYRFYRADGSIIWVIGRAVPEILDNKIIGYIGTITDITERKKSEEALKDSEAKYRQLVTQSPDGIFIVDFSERFISVNKAMCEILKYPEDELLTMELTSLIPAEYHAVHKERLQLLMKGKASSSTMEYEVFGKDAVSHFVEVLSVPYLSNGILIGFQGIARDITERKRVENKLKESEEKYRRIFENVQDVYYETTVDGIILELSPSIEQLSKGNYRRKDLIGSSIYDFYPDLAERRAFLEMIREKGNVSDFEITLRNVVTGLKVPCSITSRLFYDPEGHPEKIVGSMRDITLRKEALTALRESEQKYRSIYEYSNIAIMLSSPDGNVLSANEYACKLFGMTEAEICRLGREALVDKNDERLLPIIEERLRTGKSKGELTFLKMDGTRFEGEISSMIFTDKSGRQLTSLVIRDLTEQHEAEKAIRKSEARFRSYFESTVAGVAITSPKKEWLDVNDYLCEMLGYAKEELLKTTWPELTYPDDLDSFLDNFNKVIRGEIDAYSLETRFIRKNNEIVWTSTSARSVRLDDGTVDYLIGLIVDISEIKMYEEQLIQAKTKAEESDKLKTAFLHNISHEIRTPMNAIVGFSNLLNDQSIDEDLKKTFISTIIQNSDHLLSIISDIIEISNIEAGTLRKNITDVDLNYLIKSLYEQFSIKAVDGKIDFELTLKTGNDLHIRTDNTKLTQILSNLLGNAFKFTSRGKVQFGCEQIGNDLQFFVSDTGIGIPGNQVERIFDRFYQVEHMAARHFEGTGLGLSISKAFVELLDGKIWVKSEEGKGSVFYFTIPCTEAAKEHTGKVKQKSESNLSKHIKILVAEDNENNYNLIRIFLSHSPVILLYAKNGLEAVSLFSSNLDIDLVLMDLKMPEMDGYEATMTIKQMRPEVPVVAQTAFVAEKEKAFSAGCADIITKPFTRARLFEVLEKYLKS
jgi:PAS domain S-box-containing protein